MSSPMIGRSHPDFGKTDTAVPLPAGPTSQVTLPAVPEIRRWIDRTHQERAALQARADRLREQFEPLRKQLAGIERSIKVLDHFLAQIVVDGETMDGSPSVSRRRGARPLLLSGQWSREHAACRMCGTTDKAHKAQGFCKGCYDRRDRFLAGEEMAAGTADE